MQSLKTGFSILSGKTAKGLCSELSSGSGSNQALVALLHAHVALFQVLVSLVHVVFGPGAGLVGAV